MAAPAMGTELTSLLADRNEPNRYKIASGYEKRLEKGKHSAIIVAGLQQVSRFWGLCALTWATVVLLGGFASDLMTLDFYVVSALLLLEAARQSTTVFFSKLVTKRLFKEEHDPESLKCKDEQPKMVTTIHRHAQATHSVFAMFGLLMPSVWFVMAYWHKSGDEQNLKHNLGPSLIMFYILVFLNAVFASASVLCRLFVRGRPDPGLQSFHDEVFRTALSVGIVDAYDFDFLTFAFRKLKEDYMRNMQPLAVQEENKDLINYLYAHPKGVEIVCQNLDSNDAFEQQVAANMVGFWAKEDRIDKQTVLLTTLAEKLGRPGKTAEAAANSFSALAKEWAEKDQNPLLMICNSKDVNVVYIVVNLVLERKSPTLLVHLRALESFFCSQVIVTSIGSDAQKAKGLEEKLREIIHPRNVDRRGPRQRTKIFAASALLSLVGVTQITNQDKQDISTIDPSEEPYVWLEEKGMLERVRRELQLQPYNWPPRLRIPPSGESFWRVLPEPPAGDSTGPVMPEGESLLKTM